MRYLALLLIIILSCNASSEQEKKQPSTPKGYQLQDPQRFRVRESMQEISGLVLDPDENNIYAINDEEGRIYKIDLSADEPYPYWKFGRSGDYEDIVKTYKGWMVLKSNGTLYHVHNMFTDSTSSSEYKLSIPGKQEFESAYIDSSGQGVILLCKNCEDDKKKGVTSAYRFDLNSMQYDPAPVFQLSLDDISRLAGREIKHFRPSAATIHPIDKRLYIISNVNHMLVIATQQGKVLETYPFKNKLFLQPEGIYFAKNGDMYISNEAGEGTANILKFVYKP
ncbi:hypothetical protein KTO58_20615 [Chitinophaga pendula]|uniref:hypothetical protein n=1 Tax=Chitinophaga TaxID=79328 RepID=UPI000BB08E16|nr:MULTISPECIES: hypothetical protein [Chitinophaga]ASZ10955.1 hypothetical protein CK934_08190 [Chitinophaga sp. MD30]UCJ06056.1 hypothetical protein KTO58_20615 [Chitinophaga pendula]